jgi:hypothetical protein
MRSLAIFLFASATAILPFSAQAGTTASTGESKEVAAIPKSIPAVPADVASQTAALRQHVQPAVSAWIKQQAKVEAGRRAFDLNVLRAAVRQRFGASLASASGSGTARPTAAQTNSSLDAIVALVMMQMVSDQDNDLNALMQQVQAQTQAKQALRNLLNQVNQQIAALSKSPSQPCATAFCRQLPSNLGTLRNQIAAATRRTTASSTIYFQPLPTVNAPSTPSASSGSMSVQQLGSIQSELQNELSSMNDLSDEQSTLLQMAMNQYSQILQLMSNMLKSVGDTENAIVSNIKQ